MPSNLRIVLLALLLGCSVAAYAANCYSDPTPPRITPGGVCHPDWDYIWCSDDVLNNDGHCNPNTTGDLHCSTAQGPSYWAWAPVNPGHFGNGNCNPVPPCTKVNPPSQANTATNFGGPCPGGEAP